jgi:hypothetical protein
LVNVAALMVKRSKSAKKPAIPAGRLRQSHEHDGNMMAALEW